MENKQPSNNTTSIQLNLLGSISLVYGGKIQTLATSPATNLLGYLAIYSTTGRAVSRSRLAGAFFPDESETYARRKLSELLYRLGKLIKEQSGSVLKKNGEQLAINAIWLDVNEFNARARSPNLEDWCYAIDLYKGDLLEECEEDWVLGPRASLREMYLALLEKATHAYINSGNLPEALYYTQRWVLADPLSEAPYRLEMKLLAKMGRYPAAIEVYNHLAELLYQELGVRVLPETEKLASAIRAEMDSRSAVAKRVLFVGRRKERVDLLSHIDQLHASQGKMILVEGEAGIGKTRLLEEVAESAEWRNINVVWGKANQGTVISPYAPLDIAFRNLVHRKNPEQWKARRLPSSFGLLEQIIDHPQDPVAETSRSNRLAFTSALTKVLWWITQENPLIIILDDVQSAGTVFWEILAALVKQTQGLHILWVLSYRPNELRANATAWSGLRALDRQFTPTRLTLSGLSLEDFTDLAAWLGHPIEADFPLQLYNQTQGNPHLLMRALAQIKGPNGKVQAAGQTVREETEQSKNRTIKIHLARANVPLGKRLKEEERVEVDWTVDEGTTDSQLLQKEGKVRLRHHRLVRLINEAYYQGAIPTDAELALVLGVTERTIERDIQTLNAAGQPVYTRRRFRQQMQTARI